MKRISVSLGELKANPFKKYINNGKLDEPKIVRLMESIRQTGFWENVVCRKANGEYELGYGHKRVEAARRILGADHIVEIPVMPLTDDQMLQMMAMENATGETESVEAQVDVVVLAKKHLEEHPEACAWEKDRRANAVRLSRRESQAVNQHVHGSADCIAAFLGEGSWSVTKVKDLLRIHEKLDPSVLKILRDESGSKGHQTVSGATLGQQSGLELTKLPKETQLAVVAKIAEQNNNRATTEDVRRIVKTAKAAPAEKQHDVAVKTAIRVRDEIKQRADVRSFTKPHDNKQKEQHLMTYVITKLPVIRKACQVYDEIGDFIRGLGENVFDRPQYRVNVQIGEFRQLGRKITRIHTTLFGGEENA